MTRWLLTTFLSTLGIVDVPDFDETCKRIEEIPSLAASEPFQRYKAKKELTPDEFINLNRSIKKVMERGNSTNDP
jgi:hypothetical protein